MLWIVIKGAKVRPLGQVEPDEAYSHAVNKQELRSMLERAGVKLAAA